MSAPRMSPQWVRSSALLPREGDSVEFVLDGHEVALAGTYSRQTFHSRWSRYGVQRVRTWRPACVHHAGASEPAHPEIRRLAYFD
jgi:hypothetical protein